MEFLEPLPFDEAIAIARRKGILPTTLSSRELSELAGALKRRAVFSARVAMADHLQILGELTEKIAGGLNLDGSLGETESPLASITEAKAQLAEYLDSIGYQASPDDEGGLKDLRSDARLQLQVETNVLDTLGFARWTATQDPIALDVNPAWELVRMSNPKVPRDWPQRWREARAASSEEGATDGSDRMVALKNHPIWQALGDGAGGHEDTLGNPWPPFAFNSGMNTIDVSRDDAVALGLLDEFTTVPPQSEADLNEGMEVNAERFAPALLQQLLTDPRFDLRAGALTLANAA